MFAKAEKRKKVLEITQKYVREQIKRVKDFEEYLEETEASLEPWMNGDCSKENMTEVLWLRNELGWSDISIDLFVEKWAPPNGQYKNWAVVLQTLLLVPEERRKNSRGIIVGAKFFTGSGLWIRFLRSSMAALGFSGSVELFDIGLTASVSQEQDIRVEMYEGFYQGKGGYTWGVDDTYLAGPGQVVRRAQYESFKEQGDLRSNACFFHETEGRCFFSGIDQVKVNYEWQKGQCPCPRCSFERKFPEVVSSTLRYFDTRCLKGLWDHASIIATTLETNNSYVPSTRAAQAVSLIYAQEKNLATGENCIQPFIGEIKVEDSQLQGLPPVFQDVISLQKREEGEKKNNLPHVITVNKLVSPTLIDVSAKIAYLPEDHYAELQPLGLIKDNKRAHVYRPLPMEKKEFVSVKRYKDKYGRKYPGTRPSAPDEIWCWYCKALVLEPHDHFNRGGPFRFRGHCSIFDHSDKSDIIDLCVVCDRTFKSPDHKFSKMCSYSYRGLDKIQLKSELKKFSHGMEGILGTLKSRELPPVESWDPGEEKIVLEEFLSSLDYQ